MTTIRAFFLQIRALFSGFRKRVGETSTPLPPLVTCLHRKTLVLDVQKKGYLVELILTLILLCFLKVVFSRAVNLNPPSIFQEELIQYKHSLYLKNCWHHLLYTDAISFFAKPKFLDFWKIVNFVYKLFYCLKKNIQTNGV